MSEQEQKEIARIARMEWDEFEKRLAGAATRAPGAAASADEEAMRKFFGPEEFEELKALAARSMTARASAGSLGHVVFLPGIMGSNLITTDPGGDQDLIWINFLLLIGGQLERLRLKPDGSGDAGSLPVTASRIDKRTYTRALLTLGARWTVHPFPFDWRKHMDAAADELARLVGSIRSQSPDLPIHLVAHSMGGLVSRNFIRRHPNLWKALRGDAADSRGGRLIMLGTPNYGSFAIPQALTGVEKMVRRLEHADLSHGMSEILGILNSFVGTYLMLPAPGRIPAELRALYEAPTWGRFAVSGQHLERARMFHRDLEDEPATVDPARMAYIAGCNHETLLTMEILGPGDFHYVTSLEGDGRVPFTLGRLQGVPTWYVEESHGSLPKNETVLRAVGQILERGRTDALPANPIPPKRALPAEARWHRSMGEYLVESELEQIARRAASDQADAEEIRFAEEMLSRAVAGELRPARKPEPQPAAARPARRRSLAVHVVCGDVTRVAAPVMVVGSYKGVQPVAALGALDRALDYWISKAIQHSLLGADLGQVFFIPVQRERHRMAADAVLIAGMGEEGRFSRHDLRYLALNVTYSIFALKVDSFATVLIGAGEGNLSLESAVQGMLFGVCDGLTRQENGIERLILVELKPERHRRIVEILEAIKQQDSAAGLDIEVTSSELPKSRAASRPEPPRPSDLLPAQIHPRITIEREGDIFRFSALTEKAVVALREVEIQSFYSEGVTESLMGSLTREEQEIYGTLLHSALVPHEFQDLYRGPDQPLTLILDSSTAGFPWEMASYQRPEGLAFFGTHLGLTRQFRTRLSPQPGIKPRMDSRLRVLVVADPAPEPELQLPGARQEGQEVVRLLRQIKQETDLDIEVVGRIGWEECNPVEILALVLDGHFDILHFAGHGIFDPRHPNRSGWVFGAAKDRPGELLTVSAREVFLARRVPRLVFANACFSSVVTPNQLSAEEVNRRVAGLAEAFFERGVPNYLGAGWPVKDDLAVRFATEFYARVLTGMPAPDFAPSLLPEQEGNRRAVLHARPTTFAEALTVARRLILHEGSSWGAYQHYGQGDGRLVVPPAEAPASSGAATESKAGAARQRAAAGAGAGRRAATGRSRPRKPRPARRRS